MILSNVVVQPISASEDRTISMVACLKAGVVALSRILDKQAFIAAVIGLADRGLHTDLRGDAGHDQMGRTDPIKIRLQTGVVERPLARLLHDDLTLSRRQFGHDVAARLATDQQPPHGALVTDLERLAPAPELRRWAIRQIQLVALLGVHDRHAMRTKP